MSAAPELVLGATAADQFVVSYGKGGGVGVFTADRPLALRRGTRVAIVTPRGTETGVVLCPASVQQARLLGATACGPLLRVLTAADECAMADQRRRADEVFAFARATAEEQGVALEILDVEVLLDGRQAIVQYLGDDATIGDFAQALELRLALDVRLENFAQPLVAPEEEHGGGCGKPDCGRGADGSCSTCSTGGGCSSCGAHVDLRDYFGHLRDKMEHRERRSLA